MVEHSTESHDDHIDNKGIEVYLKEKRRRVKDAVVDSSLQGMNVHVIERFRRLVEVVDLVEVLIKERNRVKESVPVILSKILIENSHAYIR